METPAVYEAHGAVANFEDYAMNVGALVRQVALIQNVMTQVMVDGEHFGVIPGTKKPTLLKPGAEKLCMVFRLEPDYEIIREIREDAFIAYTVKCTLKHIPTGQIIASGVGSCNSREEKYRWRYDETATDKQVPKEYWDARKAGNTKEMELLIGKGMRTIKIDGTWFIASATKVVNDNPWDLDNTIMKMACKRALVAATLNATAASDIFTQDVEDMPEGTVGHKEMGKANGAASKSSTVTPAKKEGEAKKTVNDTLREELNDYCGDATAAQTLLTELTTFEGDKKDDKGKVIGKETHWMKVEDILKVSEKWAGKTLNALRKYVTAHPPGDAQRDPIVEDRTALLNQLLDKKEVPTDTRCDYLGFSLGHEIKSLQDITAAEADQLINALRAQLDGVQP